MKSELCASGKIKQRIQDIPQGTLFWSKNKRLILMRGERSEEGIVVWGKDTANGDTYSPGTVCGYFRDGDDGVRELLAPGEFVKLIQE